MVEYQSLDKKSISVMRINAVISLGIFLLILWIGYEVISDLEYSNTLGFVLKLLVVILLINAILNIILYPIIRYKRYQYAITKDKIDIKKGLFQITQTIVPIKRVQKIEQSTGPIDRIFHLSNINIYTAAGVVDIKFLKEEEATRLITLTKDLLNEKLEDQNG